MQSSKWLLFLKYSVYLVWGFLLGFSWDHWGVLTTIIILVIGGFGVDLIGLKGFNRWAVYLAGLCLSVVFKTWSVQTTALATGLTNFLIMLIILFVGFKIMEKLMPENNANKPK